MTDYAALKAALAVAPYATMTPTDAAAALSALTRTGPATFTWGAAKLVTQESGSWARIVLLAQSAMASPTGTITAAQLAAVNAVQMSDAQIIDPTASGFTAFSGGLGALETAGALTSADVTAISALAVQTTQVWPGITAGDVQTARAQP